jgi:hypothetical protein
MADFRIWATINHTAPGEFVVTVSGVPDNPNSLARVEVTMRTAPSRALANELSADLVLDMGTRLRQGGHRVVDVEDD